MKTTLACLLISLAGPAWAGDCAARSGSRTAVLVELYTAEGCTSCLAANRWLSGLQEPGDVAGRVVPLALHVDYADYLGGGHVRRDLWLRQRKLTQLQRMALVFTPQVLLQGRDFKAWGTPEFAAAVERINAQPAQAAITLELVPGAAPAFDVVASAELAPGAQRRSAALYLASYDNRHNRYIVLEWQGPIDLGSGERLVERRRLPLLPGAVPAGSGVAAFVQDRGTGEVLQALMLSACFS